MNQLALRPNCLLTRRPLKFIPGPCSIFFYKKPFGEVPEILYQHGYQTTVLRFPFQNAELRKKALQLQKENLNNSHLIVGLSTAIELNLFEMIHEIKNSTISLVHYKPISNLPKGSYLFNANYELTNLRYIIHKAWCHSNKITVPPLQETLFKAPRQTWEKLLDHCVELAELDFNLEN